MGRTYSRHSAELYELGPKHIGVGDSLMAPAPFSSTAVFYVGYRQIDGIFSSQSMIRCASAEDGEIDLNFVDFPSLRRITSIHVEEDSLYVWGELENNEAMPPDSQFNLFVFDISAITKGDAIPAPRKFCVDGHGSYEMNGLDRMDEGVRATLAGVYPQLMFINVDIDELRPEFRSQTIKSGAVTTIAMNNGLTLAALWDRTVLVPTPFINSCSDQDVQIDMLDNYNSKEVSTDAAISARKDMAAVGYGNGRVRLWDTRFFKRPFYDLKSANPYVEGTHVTSIVFNDLGNELYVSRTGIHPQLPWIECYDLSTMESTEVLIAPEIPFTAESTQYLDIEGTWPRGKTRFTLPDTKDFMQLTDEFLRVRQSMFVEPKAMLWRDNKSVVGSSKSLFFIDQAPMLQKFTYSIYTSHGYKSMFHF